jgi:hypothetical protein
VLLGSRAGDEHGAGAGVAVWLDQGARRVDARAALDDPVLAALLAQSEPAAPLHPHGDWHRQAAMQERARDVAELGRRQVTRKRCSERIIKALGRRAGSVHKPQCSRLNSYTLAFE